MFPWEIKYNVALLIADVFLTLFFLKKKSIPSLITGIFFYGLLSLAFAFLFSPDNFGKLRLLCYAVFIHGIILCDVFFLLLLKQFKSLAILSAALSFIIMIIGVDAFFIEPHSLEISRVNIKSAKVKEPFKIVVLSDLQTDEITGYEKNVLELVASEKPDVILLPGDYVQTEDIQKRNKLYSELNQLLKEKNFKAPMGVYAVEGNVDAPDWTKIFEGLNVTCFKKTESIRKDKVIITGLGLFDSFNGNLPSPIGEVGGGFHIIFGHAPDFALSKPDADLLIAGHTHGGQVRIPFLGAIFTLSDVPQKWASGITDIDDDTKLIVSRGIGMERDNAPRLRFLCKPEMVVVTVEPE